jgi:hypothetical protein
MAASFACGAGQLKDAPKARRDAGGLGPLSADLPRPASSQSTMGFRAIQHREECRLSLHFLPSNVIPESA